MQNKNNKIIGKKGQVGKVVEIILIIAGAIILYLFISMVTSKSTFDEAINTCRFSVIAQTATEFKPGITGAKSPFGINCEERYINFYNTKVELGLSSINMKPRPINVDGKQVNTFKILTDFTVDQVVAEEMRICKYEFGDGQMDVFVNNDYVLHSKDVCFICSEIRFVNVKQSSFSTLVDYTQKTTFDESKVTYFDYLTQKTIYNVSMWIQPFFDAKKDPYYNLSIDTSKSYAVIIKKYSEGKWMKINPDYLGNGLAGDMLTIAQGIKDLFTSKENQENHIAPLTVAIVPLTDINKYCDVQAS